MWWQTKSAAWIVTVKFVLWWLVCGPEAVLCCSLQLMCMLPVSGKCTWCLEHGILKDGRHFSSQTCRHCTDYRRPVLQETHCICVVRLFTFHMFLSADSLIWKPRHIENFLQPLEIVFYLFHMPTNREPLFHWFIHTTYYNTQSLSKNPS